MFTKILGQADWRNDQRVVPDHHEVDTEVDILDALEFPRDFGFDLFELRLSGRVEVFGGHVEMEVVPPQESRSAVSVVGWCSFRISKAILLNGAVSRPHQYNSFSDG